MGGSGFDPTLVQDLDQKLLDSIDRGGLLCDGGANANEEHLFECWTGKEDHIPVEGKIDHKCIVISERFGERWG